jgi:hypothetical protein
MTLAKKRSPNKANSSPIKDRGSPKGAKPKDEDVIKTEKDDGEEMPAASGDAEVEV